MTEPDGNARGRVDLQPLSIKSVVGGGLEDKRWTAELDALQADLQDIHGKAPGPFNLTVTYVVPGEVYAPKFSGIRIGSFLEEFQSLVVQVALPRHPDGDARTKVLELLDNAISRAEAWGNRKKRLVGRLEEARDVAALLRG